MKKVFVSILTIILMFSISAQEKQTLIKTNILIGTKYTPLDYIWGGVFGVNFYYKKLGFSIRNDFSFKVSKKDSLSYYGLTDVRAYNYFDFSYKLYKNTTASVAYGWVSNKNEIHRFNLAFGYTVVSLAISQKLTNHIVFELRGDIPLQKENPLIDENYAFPVSLSVGYLFN